MDKFGVIIADPPWSFDDKLQRMKIATKRSARSQYRTMSLSEIEQLPVKELIDPKGCVLALWVPSSQIEAGLQVMKSWGFKMKQTFIWIKLKKGFKTENDINSITRVGMGRLFRQSHEIALIGTAGKSATKKLKNRSQRSVCFDLNVAHSVKPNILHDRLDLMFPDDNKLELFARRTRKNWITIGDGIDGLNIEQSIQNLIDNDGEEKDV